MRHTIYAAAPRLVAVASSPYTQLRNGWLKNLWELAIPAGMPTGGDEGGFRNRSFVGDFERRNGRSVEGIHETGAQPRAKRRCPAAPRTRRVRRYRNRATINAAPGEASPKDR